MTPRWSLCIWALAGACATLAAQAQGPGAASATPDSGATSGHPAATAATGPLPQLLRVLPPRESAHHVADVVELRALIAWPAGWAVDRDGLPYNGREDQPFELRSHRLEAARDDDACQPCQWLVLRWQLFKPVRLGEDVRLPAVRVRLRRDREHHVLDLPQVKVAMFPLVPWEARREWLSSQRPGWVAVPFEPADRLAEAAAAAAVATAAALAWAWSSGRWLPRHAHRPWAQAARQLRRRRREPTLAMADEADLRCFHQALDRCAGQAVFESDLDRFLAERPAFEPWASALRGVFAHSQRLFFLGPCGHAGPGLPADTLIDLVQRLAQAELVEARSPALPPSQARSAPPRHA